MSAALHQGDALTVLRTLDAGSVVMKAKDINARILVLLGNDVQLRADYGEDGILYLRDNVNECEVADETPDAIDHLIHEWAIYAGYTIEEFEEFANA